MPLQDLVRQLMDSGSVAASTGLDETVGPVNTFLTQVGQQGGATGKLTRRVFRGQTHDGEVDLDTSPDADDAPRAPRISS